MKQSTQHITREVERCVAEFPDFDTVRPLVLQLAKLQAEVSKRPLLSVSRGNEPLIGALSLDKAAVMQHLKGVVKALNTASLGTVPSPKTLEEIIDQRLERFVADLPADPARCCVELEAAGLSHDVATLLLWATFSPFFAQACEKVLKPEDLSEWTKGSCPVCGAKPHMAKLREEDGARILECWLCGAQWQFARLKCPYCDNVDQETLGFFHIDEDKARRVYFCRRCNSYIKVVDVRELKRDPVLSIQNLATIDYDSAAVLEGFKAGSGLTWAARNSKEN